MTTGAGSTGLPSRPPINGRAAALEGQNEPVGLGSKPIQRKREAEPRRLVGKDLTDAVAGILAGGSVDDEGDQDDEGAQDEGAQGRERPAGRDDGDEAVGDEAGSEGQDDGIEHETSMEDVARALKLKASELNKVAVTVDGGRVTLGELKAGWSKVAKLDQERAEFDERVTTTQLEQIDAHRRLMAIIDELPPQGLPPAVLQRVNQQYEQDKRAQAALLTKARPEWGDAKYVEKERGAMLDLAKRYGFTPAEIGSILDHRQILLLQDFARAQARIDAAKGAARKVDLAGNKPLAQETGRAAFASRTEQQQGKSNKSQLARRVADLIAKG